MTNASVVFVWLVLSAILIIFIIYEIRSIREYPKCGSYMKYDSHTDGSIEASFLYCPLCGYKEVLDEGELKE